MNNLDNSTNKQNIDKNIKTTVELNNETKARTANKVLPKAGLNGFNWAFVQGSTFVLRLSFCAKNPAFGNTQNDVAKSAPLLLPHRFGGLHPQMLLVATRTSHICEFAKSQERKQTSFLGLRKSAEPLSVRLKDDTTTRNRKTKNEINGNLENI